MLACSLFCYWGRGETTPPYQKSFGATDPIALIVLLPLHMRRLGNTYLRSCIIGTSVSKPHTYE